MLVNDASYEHFEFGWHIIPQSRAAQFQGGAHESSNPADLSLGRFRSVLDIRNDLVDRKWHLKHNWSVNWWCDGWGALVLCDSLVHALAEEWAVSGDRTN